ncbi:MAG: LTA synthase family protein [Acidobacteriia bacterium]|nr:LTA synthase family protein [Terriglobia bacterium]
MTARRFCCAPILVTMVLGGGSASARAGTPPLAWGVESTRTPSLFWADRNADITMRLKNLGSETWSEAAGDHLSYHWRKPDGSVVEWDGMRARFRQPVRPGEAVELVARVHAPEASGRWLFEWEMVREQVAWYGPPVGGAPLRIPVLVVWRCALLEIGFAIGGIAGALVSRRHRPPQVSWLWALVDAGPVLWTWLGVGLATITFSEVAHHQLWRGGAVLAASAAALVALPVVLVPGRWRSWIAAGTVVVANLVAVADVLYLRFFDNVVPLVALSAVGQLGQVGGSVHALLRLTDGWLAVGAASAVALGLLWPRRKKGEAAPVRARRVALGVALLVCAAAGVPAVWTLRAGMGDPSTADQLFSKGALVGRWGLVNVHVFDALRTYREWAERNAPGPGEEAKVRSLLAARAAESTAHGPAFGVAKGANLVLIQVESLQQWVIGTRVGGAEITPFLNGLRSRALYFPFVFDQTGQGRSSDGEFAVLNSQHGLDRGAVAFRRPHNHFVTLASALRDHGYATLSAHGFEKGFWNRGVLHPRFGFERMLFKDELGGGETIGWGLADGVFFDRMVGLLKQERAPYFAFLITLGLHHPFDLFPDRHKVLDIGALKDTPLGNYIHAMHYFDASLGAFVAELERTDVLSNTVVALYGDHESGLYVDAPLLKLVGETRWEPSVLVRLRRVPVFVLLPGAKLSGEVSVLGGQLDLAPTLLSLLGVAPPGCFVGHVLDGRARAPVVLNDGSVVAGDRLYVAEGPAIPDGGACFAWPSGAPRPLSECADLDRYGDEQLAASRFVVLHDLAAKIAATPLP